MITKAKKRFSMPTHLSTRLLRLNLNRLILKRERGIAALVVIVIVGAAALVLVQGAALLGLGELDTAYTSQKGNEAFSVADGCMEEAMRRIRTNTGYTGGSLNVSNGSCTITVTGSGPYTLTVLGTTGSFNKKIEAVVGVSNRVITVNSWEEKDN